MAKAKVTSKQKAFAGLNLESHQIIDRPLVTEKGTMLAEGTNTYLFKVHPAASKPQIKKAIEAIFKVTVTGVRTQTRKGKPRRYRQHMSEGTAWKKALVTLSENDRITLF